MMQMAVVRSQCITALTSTPICRSELAERNGGRLAALATPHSGVCDLGGSQLLVFPFLNDAVPSENQLPADATPQPRGRKTTSESKRQNCRAIYDDCGARQTLLFSRYECGSPDVCCMRCPLRTECVRRYMERRRILWREEHLLASALRGVPT